MTKEKNKKNLLRSLATTCFFILILAGSFLFAKDSLAVPNNYTKNATSTLLAAEWNNLFSDFVNTWQSTSMVGPLGIGIASPLNVLHVYSTGSANNISIDGNNNPAMVLRSSGVIKGYSPIMVTANGSFFTDSLAGDMGFRSEANKILFGVGSGLSTMAISGSNVGIGTTAPNDKLSIGNSGSAPIGSVNTGHNYTMTYLSTDQYALINYGTVLTLLNAATSSITSFWGGTLGSNIWSLNTGNIGINTTTPSFKFDINGTFRASSANISGLGAGVVMTDASGTLYATSTLPSGYATGVGVFVGPSTTSTTGTNNGNPGYDVAYSYCETDYPGSHVCTPDEMLNNIRHGAIYPTVNVWIFSGPPGYTASANDCNGRRGAATTDLGAYWEGLTGSFPKGRGLLMACNQSLKIACCK